MQLQKCQSETRREKGVLTSNTSHKKEREGRRERERKTERWRGATTKKVNDFKKLRQKFASQIVSRFCNSFQIISGKVLKACPDIFTFHIGIR